MMKCMVHLSWAPNIVPVKSFPHASPAMYRLGKDGDIYDANLEDFDDGNNSVLPQRSVHVFIQHIWDSGWPDWIGTKEERVPENFDGDKKDIPKNNTF